MKTSPVASAHPQRRVRHGVSEEPELFARYSKQDYVGGSVAQWSSLRLGYPTNPSSRSLL